MSRLPLHKQEQKRFLSLLLGQCADKTGVRIYVNPIRKTIRMKGLTESLKKDFATHRVNILEMLKNYELRKQKEREKHEEELRQLELERDRDFWGYMLDNGLYEQKPAIEVGG